MNIPARFQRAILLHLFKNLSPRPESAPLILGIHGPPGEGKTFQVERLVDSIGARIERVSGREFESGTAGQPAERIHEAYESAAAYRYSTEGAMPPAVVVINDIDAVIGNWGPHVQYTVNRQLVFAELMRLSDFPLDDQVASSRVPVVVTGNDLSKLYAPLLRLGRMQLFSWEPEENEKVEVVVGMYPELSCDACTDLLRAFPGQPIAFFSQLRNQLYDEGLWTYIQRTGIPEAFTGLSTGRIPRIPVDVDLSNLRQAGVSLLRSREGIDGMVSAE
jgi:hypothetical protein